MTPVSETLNGCAIVTIIIYGGMQVMNGESTAGRLFSFIAAFLLAFEPMKRLTRVSNTMQMGLASLDRTFKLLDTKPRIVEKTGAAILQVRNPVLTFDDVRFVYANGAEALKGVSFTAPGGKTVALVGESGAGKSTILSLIPRFYDVAAGSIAIDGWDIREVTLKSLRASMALVSQEVAIFSDTVRENIAYGTPGAADIEIISAARLAAAHEFILEQPQGYDTVVGENGMKLSGGQRQRISIARAFLRNAPILLLDEATSALDANSERLVQAALKKLQSGRTTIVVAHRLSTIMKRTLFSSWRTVGLWRAETMRRFLDGMAPIRSSMAGCLKKEHRNECTLRLFFPAVSWRAVVDEAQGGAPLRHFSPCRRRDNLALGSRELADRAENATVVSDGNRRPCRFQRIV